MKKTKRLKLLYFTFIFVLFLELIGSLGAVFFSDSSAIRDAGLSNTFLVVITTIVVLIPWMIERKFKIDIPDVLEVVLVIMLFIAVVLGFLNDYYVNVSGFDKITHALSGMTLSVIAFQTLYVLNKYKSSTFKMGTLVMSLFAYTFSITLLVIWEFYEFFIDTISYTFDANTTSNMQRYQNINSSLVFPQGYGLYDTMIDLIVGAIGALLVVTFAYIYIKKNGRTLLEKNLDN